MFNIESSTMSTKTPEDIAEINVIEKVSWDRGDVEGYAK